MRPRLSSRMPPSRWRIRRSAIILHAILHLRGWIYSIAGPFHCSLLAWRRVGRSLIRARTRETGWQRPGAAAAIRWSCAPVAAISDAIPSFQAVADVPATTALSLRAFLRTSHAAMPDLKLPDPQIEDLAADILGLRAAVSR